MTNKRKSTVEYRAEQLGIKIPQTKIRQWKREAKILVEYLTKPESAPHKDRTLK